MKKLIYTVAVIFMVISAQAQSKFDVKDFGDFKLHSYATADPLGNMSYIIEGENKLVVLEPVLFHENIKEFGEYLSNLNKPVEKVIASYHAAGFNAFDPSTIVMIEDMVEFEKTETYTGMLAYFASTFGDAMDSRGHEPTATVAKNAKTKWAGIEFRFSAGSSSDFPASSILIGGKVYYMHFAPVANMHMSPLQITNCEAVSATIEELERAKASGATTFIGGHGMSSAEVNAVDFQIEYLKKVKDTVAKVKTGDEFISVMNTKYKDIAGEDSLIAIAANLYK